jgi:hypothetical protein
MYRTLKTVEGVRNAAKRYLKRLVVGVAANFAGFHLLHGSVLRVSEESECG